eukprot:COSAG02_NODE_50545_length_320_cov_0.375566_1_plen_55_part_00
MGIGVDAVGGGREGRRVERGGKVAGGTCWRCMPLRLILSFSLPAASVMTRSGLW